jgi:hypothetical protein
MTVSHSQPRLPSGFSFSQNKKCGLRRPHESLVFILRPANADMEAGRLLFRSKQRTHLHQVRERRRREAPRGLEGAICRCRSRRWRELRSALMADDRRRHRFRLAERAFLPLFHLLGRRKINDLSLALRGTAGERRPARGWARCIGYRRHRHRFCRIRRTLLLRRRRRNRQIVVPLLSTERARDLWSRISHHLSLRCRLKDRWDYSEL